MSSRTEMTSFGHFHRNSFNQNTPFSKQNHKSNLNQPTTLLNINSYISVHFFLTNNPYKIPYIPFLGFFLNFSSPSLLPFFLLLLLFLFSSLLFSSGLPYPKDINEIFCLSLIRPCLALYNFGFLFGFLLLFIIELIQIPTSTYKLLILRPFGHKLVNY